MPARRYYWYVVDKDTGEAVSRHGSPMVACRRLSEYLYRNPHTDAAVQTPAGRFISVQSIIRDDQRRKATVGE